jgi:EAL domain-containing protein (putative c-di-GMP-specific phosphodiesterase class I)
LRTHLTDVLDARKIDRQFVKDVHTSAVNGALVSSIVALSEGLNLGTVAEGLETQAQLASLRGLGCQFMQGHLFSLPVAVKRIITLWGRDWPKGPA